MLFLSGLQLLRPNFHSGSNFSKNLQSKAKISLHDLSILKKHMTAILRLNFGRFCRSMAFMVSCHAPLSHSVADRRFVLGLMTSNQKPFVDGVGLRQGCVLSPLFFIVYMNWIAKCSQADGCATIRNCKISRLPFSDDFVLLSSIESGLHRALKCFADAYEQPE